LPAMLSEARVCPYPFRLLSFPPGDWSNLEADVMKIGKFQVLGNLGMGANSSILHVRRSSDSRQYALKVVPISAPEDRKFLAQAQHEFRVSSMLDHRNLIKIFALEAQRDWLFRIRKVLLLLEYVNGQTLDTMKQLPVPKLVQIFAQVAAGLAHMHRRGVYHADIKPGNILLSRSGEVRIIDYGLAWIKGESKGRIQGTPEYMAPEQAKKKIVNEQTDIYNLGATMYRLVTWRLPPSNILEDEVLNERRREQLLKPVEECNPKAPPELCQLIHQCLEVKPSRRPERMIAVQETLEGLERTVVQSPEDRLEALEW
jgi:eukaryotic-like serine/threonine-protein kinase